MLNTSRYDLRFKRYGHRKINIQSALINNKTLEKKLIGPKTYWAQQKRKKNKTKKKKKRKKRKGAPGPYQWALAHFGLEGEAAWPGLLALGPWLGRGRGWAAPGLAGWDERLARASLPEQRRR